ncbi:hypothetical protein [Gloeobacter kilaueensis]|uniref:hypothetical protein n=1 Tax=Gloeobacter kilaueensis TaxID=1416614 RepID=UPI0011834372|nr:hypothetical protein [Gloeobacter kilaueensis]
MVEDFALKYGLLEHQAESFLNIDQWNPALRRRYQGATTLNDRIVVLRERLVGFLPECQDELNEWR